jgi:hypothetical protein
VVNVELRTKLSVLWLVVNVRTFLFAEEWFGNQAGDISRGFNSVTTMRWNGHFAATRQIRDHCLRVEMQGH